MKYIFIFFYFLLFTVVAFFFSYYIGLFEIPDAYFYYVFGRFLTTGQLNSVAPFNATDNPSTLFGPVYSILSHTFVDPPPGPQLFLPFIHLLMISVSNILLFFSSKKYLTTKLAITACLIFLFLPFNLLYAFVYMSETTTMFLVSLCLFIYTRINNSLVKYSLILFLTSVLALTRFAFITWFILAVCMFFFTIYKKVPAMKQKPQKLLFLLPGIIGCLLMFWWIMFHVKYYNKLTLSTHTGRHLYNNVITAGKFVPKDRSNPQIAQFFTYVPEIKETTPPWWEVQSYFADPFYRGEITELEVDRLYLAVSIQGIKENVFPYVLHLVTTAFITPNTPPYFDKVLTQLGDTTECPTCTIPRCRFMWILTYCKPLGSNTFLNTIFITFIHMNQRMYPVVTIFLMFLALLGTVKILLKKNIQLIVIAGIFYLQHFFQSVSEWVEGRFLLPLYPLYALLIIFGICMIVDIFTVLQTHKNSIHTDIKTKEQS